MNNTTNSTHRRVQRSTTLNRKYVKDPSMRRAPNSARPTRQIDPLTKKSIKKSPTTTPTIAKKSSSSRDVAIDSAMRSVAQMNSSSPEKLKTRSVFSLKHIALALVCAAAVVAIIFFCANQSMPDLSVRVAAMQSGIDASYPSYIPREYSPTDIVSEDGKISLTFASSNGDFFTLTEENSSWDSTALEENYVKSHFRDYVPIREQGLTLFISGSNCVWVNGGKLFTIDASGNNLSKKQLKSIAVSL